MVFLGYTIILVMDKVLFDTNNMFANDKNGDPAKVKLETNLKAQIEMSEGVPNDE